MAYDARYCRSTSVGVAARPGSSKTLRDWRYMTADSLATVMAPGYFPADGGFNVGDTVLVSCSIAATAEAIQLIVTGISPVTVSTAADTVAQGLAAGAAAQAKQRQLNSDNIGVVTIKPCGILTSAATGGGTTRSMAFCSTVPFSAVELSYVHLGGNGAATGIIACVAPTDNPGALDYSLGNVVSNKKFVVPQRGGNEYNSLSADGWQAVTWGGASSASAADAGAGKISIAQSDVIPCQAIPAADGSGLYWVLVRWFEASGPRSYGNYPGIATGTQYNDDAGFAKIFFSTGNSGDQITEPATLSTSNTQYFSSSPAPNIMVRLHSLSSSPPKTIMTVGDSRFDAVTEAPDVTGAAYRSFGFKLAKALTDVGGNADAGSGGAGGSLLHGPDGSPGGSFGHGIGPGGGGAALDDDGGSAGLFGASGAGCVAGKTPGRGAPSVVYVAWTPTIYAELAAIDEPDAASFFGGPAVLIDLAALDEPDLADMTARPGRRPTAFASVFM